MLLQGIIVQRKPTRICEPPDREDRDGGTGGGGGGGRWGGGGGEYGPFLDRKGSSKKGLVYSRPIRRRNKTFRILGPPLDPPMPSVLVLLSKAKAPKHWRYTCGRL